ncbi:MAG TPA: tRNA (guanine-N7)-methyltransferase [Polyangiaceae bacterium]|nr:tRNA (guanine-N7)-methyltransferase [Polyangiaceae bacterium]
MALPPSKKVSPYARAPRLPEEGEIDPRNVLSASKPIELEIGPGHGGFILERLVSEPNTYIMGLEVRRKWATLVDERIQALGFAPRGRVFSEDARAALPRFTSGSLARIYVHFPDPWWKKRHSKRRVVSPEFVDQAARLLISGGDVFIQTDVPERAGLYEELFTGHAAFDPWGESARVDDPNFGARSPRERRALADGLPFARLRFRRR